MDCFKEKRLPIFNNMLITLFLFTLSAPCVAELKTQSTTTTTALFNKPSDFRWSGAYLGGYIGGAWGNANVSTSAGTVSDSSYFSTNDNIIAVAQNGSQTFTPNAFIGGVQFGDAWMFKNFVYGFVLDVGSLNLNDKKIVQNSAYPDGSGSYTINTSLNTNWMYTIRGRLGWAPNLAWPVMLYGTSGLAVTKVKVSNQFSDTTTLAGIGTASNNATLNGWTVGGGIEFPIAQNFTINGEYLYANFGSVSAQSAVYNSTAGFGIDYQSLSSRLSTTPHFYSNLLKFGLNYKFNS